MDLQDQVRFVTVDGLLLAKLSPANRRELLAPVRTTRRAQLIDNLKLANITGEEMIAEVGAFDQYAWGDREYYNFMQSLDGRAAVIAFSATKAKADPAKVDDVLDTMGMDDDFKLAAKLSGVALQPRDLEAERAYEKRLRYRADLVAAGFKADDLITRMNDYDNEHDIEPARPSDADS